MYEHNRAKCYSQLRNLISEDDFIKYIHLVNKIKDHRNNKTRNKQMDKFEQLVRKSSGYLHSLDSSGIFDNSIPLGVHAPDTIHSHSNNCTTTPGPVSVAKAPATAPTTAPNTVAPLITKQKWVINLSNTPNSSARISIIKRS